MGAPLLLDGSPLGHRNDVLVDEQLLGAWLRFSKDVCDIPLSRGVVFALGRSLVGTRLGTLRGVLEGGFFGLGSGENGIVRARPEFLCGRLLGRRNDVLVVSSSCSARRDSAYPASSADSS